ncbi:flagellar basal body-associated FliL family protein [Quadrisphaera oryzae]|uniref:flagellar basal body-associated FliL family protein n=1 Tax=Quadrisphaera TaxID=317661 RepID=UPI001644ECAE|nr:flagellar basal body-associated FliL family protein [Quadrisphaera sp. RL12-1S]MBC3763755.1 flagellar basal body-associated FliL family protein [Quadrisphaera sp. RL12-1S]
MATATATPAETEAPKKKGPNKLVLILVAVIVLMGGGGAAYFLVLAPKAPPTAEEQAAAAKAEQEAKLGKVKTLDPISVNLADGHFLKIGIALQESSAVTEDVDGSKALDAVIALYSGTSMADISTPEGRDKYKAELVKSIKEAYDDKVLDVYLTQYVMQ